MQKYFEFISPARLKNDRVFAVVLSNISCTLVPLTSESSFATANLSLGEA